MPTEEGAKRRPGRGVARTDLFEREVRLHPAVTTEMGKIRRW
jgi:hypothetical protein